MPAQPTTWYFPTPDPNVVIACDYNAAEKQYNLNCRQVALQDVPNHVASAIQQSYHAQT